LERVSGLYSLSELHFGTELYAVNERNILLKTMNSHLFPIIAAHTPLKQLVFEAIKDQGEWELNHVDYPSLADLVNHKKKIVILIEDKNR
jgi:hypothetical protein